MKGGSTPILRQPWYATDYHNDEHVKLLKRRRAYKILTFYRHFLDFSFLAGGDLPSDPQHLAAVLEMPCQDVRDGLAFCLGRLIEEEGGRLYQKRVRRDLAVEIGFREIQREHGKKGGRPHRKATLSGSETQTPPSTPPSTSTPTTATDSAQPRGDASRPVAWSREACDAWIERFGGTAPGGQIGKSLKPLVDRHGWEIVRQAWCSYLRQVEADYASPSRFASTYGRWSGTAPPGGKAGTEARTMANLQAWVAGKEGGR